MYEKAKEIIMSGDFELEQAVETVELWALRGTITRQQADELVNLAREHADPTMTATLTHRIEELERRVGILEQTDTGTSGPAEEWPEYVQGRSYYNGNQVTFEGKHYICTAPKGKVCVWTPTAYPAYWTAA